MPRLLIIVVVIGAAVLAALAYVARGWLLTSAPPAVRDRVLGTLLGYRAEYDVMIPMKDGTRLATNLYLPTRYDPPYPTVLVRLMYGKDTYFEARQWVTKFAPRGYAVAVQDMRGRYKSEGTFAPYRHDAEDGSATVDWLAVQPWSNGKVGTIGCSGLGETQILLAAERNPHHAAMVAIAAGGAIGSAGNRYGYFGLFEGGVFNLAAGLGWFANSGSKTPGAEFDGKVADIGQALNRLPLVDLVRNLRSDPTDYDEFVSTPLDDVYWREMGFITDDAHFATPAININSWHDQTIADTLVLSELMKRNGDKESRSNHHVIVGPGLHCDMEMAGARGTVGALALGPNAAQPYKEWFAAWFDEVLKGDASNALELPPYRFYVLGEDRWFDTESWPPPGVRETRWYLGGDTPANSVEGGGTLAREPPLGRERYDEFRYDPADPVPTRGGPICCAGKMSEEAGPVDQRDVEARRDVLVYTSPALEQGLRIAGPITAELFVASSAKDTDFTAKLVDVDPDGRALNIQEGALRMRYRDGFTLPVMMRPGEVYKARVDMRAIAYFLQPGHRLRLEIASSNFPRLERNLNTGGRNFDETVGVVAANRVFTTADQPSAVVIPEWPETSGAKPYP